MHAYTSKTITIISHKIIRFVQWIHLVVHSFNNWTLPAYVV